MSTYEKSKVNRIKRGANRGTYDVATINTILDAGFVGYVSYIYDGQAISIPMAYGRNKDKIYLHGSTANRMLLSALASEKISMTVMHLDALVLARSGFHHSVNYRSATVFGTPKKVVNDHDKEAALICIMDHMLPGRWDSLRTMNQKELDRTLVVEVGIDTASAKIRDVGVADEPEDENLPIWAGLVPLKQIALPPISDEKLPDDVLIPQHVTDYYKNNQ